MSGSFRGLKVSIRPIKIIDGIPARLKEFMDIESVCFQFPWNEEDFVKFLNRQDAHGAIAVYENEIIGFVIFKVKKKCIELVSIAVHPKYQRNGVGRQLVKFCINNLSRRRNIMIADVRETNLKAQLFFRDLNGKNAGFKATLPILLNRYISESGGQENAYRMEYHLPSSGKEKIPVFQGRNRITHFLSGSQQ